jgi:hypothetical protein
MATQVFKDTAKLEQLLRDSPSKAHDLVFSLLHDGEAYVKDSFGSEGSPSPAGAPPGIDTGELKNSIQVHELGRTSGEIITDKEYAWALEMGYSGHNLAARPFMLPMAYWLEEQVGPTFERFVDD